MKIWSLVFCLMALSLFAYAQETCSCSAQLTQMQMQSQVDRDNFNFRLDQQERNSNSTITALQIQLQNKMDEDFRQHDQFILTENNRMIDTILLRVIIALFATSGWFVSLIMVIIYWRW